MSKQTFHLVVSGDVSHSGAHYSALNFAKAALGAGHTINSVFFYACAVEVANELAHGLSDELDVRGEWISLSQKYGFALNACISSSERRGVLDADSAKQNNQSVANMHDAFTVVGLGVLQEQSRLADRVMSFR